MGVGVGPSALGWELASPTAGALQYGVLHLNHGVCNRNAAPRFEPRVLVGRPGDGVASGLGEACVGRH